MKKGISFILIMVLLLTMFNVPVFVYGTGPMEINNWVDLYNIGTDESTLNGNYKLMYDLTPGSIGYDTYASSGAFNGAGWQPIGNSTKPFTGTFDGNGCTISGLVINGGTSEQIGLFGKIEYPATISNIGLIDVNITGGARVGGLVGWSKGGNISGSSVTGVINSGHGQTFPSNPDASALYFGGLIGYNETSGSGGGNITNSYANVTVSAASSSNVGGLVGLTNGTISKSYAAGNVTGDYIVGGLIGYNGGTIQNTFALGNVVGNPTRYTPGSVMGVGGLAGYNNGTISYTYATGTVTGPALVTGGMVGEQSGSSSVSTSFWDKDTSNTEIGRAGSGSSYNFPYMKRTTAEMKTQSTFKDSVSSPSQWSWDFAPGGIWAIVKGTSPVSWSYPYFQWMESTPGWEAEQAPGYGEKDFANGAGTAEDPYQITSAAELSAIRNNLSAHYILTTVVAIQAEDYQDDGAFYNYGKGWEPIGTESKPFKGKFNGNGMTISGLYLSYGDSDSNIGFFGYIGSPAVISRAAITNITVSGLATNVGGLVGYSNGGKIVRSFVSGTIEGGSNVGGLLGRNEGNGEVNTSYATSNVSGSGVNIGGLLGKNASGSSITNAYASGSVTGGDTVGGLMGWNGGIIQFTYAANGVTGTSNIGGLIGENTANIGFVSDSFWDNVISVATSGVASGDGIGITGAITADLMKKGTFTTSPSTWDFSKIWTINEGTSYPYFIVSTTNSGGDTGDGGTGGGGTGGGTGGGGGGGGTAPQNNGGVIVNGQPLVTGNETTSMENGKSTVKLKLDNQAFGSILNAIKNSQNGKGNEIQLAINNTGAQVAAVDLSGDLLKNLEKNTVVISIKHNDVEYVIPAAEFNIGRVAETLGVPESQLLNIQVEVKISKVDAAAVELYKKAAAKNNDEILVTPITFEIKARATKADGTAAEVAIGKFNNFVERITEVPAGVDPTKITTGIVFNADGTYSHVPTEVFVKDGKYYAKLNSLTNSNYSVIWNPITVASVVNHWSEKAVNDMASRMVVFNTDSFAPDQAITRADFAEYIVRALGLYQQSLGQGIAFADVSSTGDRTKAIQIANQYGIITGYPDGSFRPDQLITREEAMAMYQRAMTVAKLTGNDSGRYQNYADYSQVEEWARGYVKEVLSAHVFNGTTATTISPKANLTYAESAQAIRNLLTESKLINQ